MQNFFVICLKRFLHHIRLVLMVQVCMGAPVVIANVCILAQQIVQKFVKVHWEDVLVVMVHVVQHVQSFALTAVLDYLNNFFVKTAY